MNPPSCTDSLKLATTSSSVGGHLPWRGVVSRAGLAHAACYVRSERYKCRVHALPSPALLLKQQRQLLAPPVELSVRTHRLAQDVQQPVLDSIRLFNLRACNQILGGLGAPRNISPQVLHIAT
jgi:hypothetical protein